MTVMKRIGGGLEQENPYALYKCSKHHVVKVFSHFNYIVFSKWENAPDQLDIACLECNLEAGCIDDDD